MKKPQVINVRALKVEFSLLHEIVHFSIEFLGSPGSFCCTHESFHSFEDFGKSCKIVNLRFSSLLRNALCLDCKAYCLTLPLNWKILIWFIIVWNMKEWLLETIFLLSISRVWVSVTWLSRTRLTKVYILLSSSAIITPSRSFKTSKNVSCNWSTLKTEWLNCFSVNECTYKKPSGWSSSLHTGNENSKSL